MIIWKRRTGCHLLQVILQTDRYRDRQIADRWTETNRLDRQNRRQTGQIKQTTGQTKQTTDWADKTDRIDKTGRQM